jgi:hypothetical protein
MKLGKYITLAEAIKSQQAIYHGIKNEPAGNEISAMAKFCANIYDPLCDHFGIKLPFSSFYRSKGLNSIIKGASTTSQHCQGEAMDIDLDVSGLAITNSVVFQYIMNNLPFDQLIWEFGNKLNPAWVHVSHDSGNMQRGMIITSYKDSSGRTKYKKYDG